MNDRESTQILKCPHHSNHEFRITTLEDDMKENQQKIEKINPAFWMGIITLLTGLLSTVGSIGGYIIAAYLKKEGML